MNHRSPDVARSVCVKLLCLTAALLSMPLCAQGPPGNTFSATVDVELVNIEAWVEDSAGKPVRDLTREDFVLLHDGERTEISHITEIRDRRPVGIESDAPEQGAHLAILFDTERLTPYSQERLARQLRGHLLDGSTPAEKILILHTGSGLVVETPFGSSSDDIEAALERLGQRKADSADSGSEIKQIVQALQDIWADLNSTTANRSIRSRVNQVTGPSVSQRSGLLSGSGATPAAGTPGPTATQACDDFVDRAEPVVSAWGSKELRRIERSLSRLSDVGAFLSGLDGPKTLLYLSDGLTLTPGAAAASFVRGLCPTFQTDLEVDSLPQQIEQSFVDLARTLGTNQITMHPIQGSGIQAAIPSETTGSSSDSRGQRAFQREHSTTARRALGLLAEETGGRLLAGSNLDRGLRQISHELGNYYSLAFTPASGTDDEHTIDLEAQDDALTVRHRRVYRDTPPEQWLTERLESALYLGMVSNPLEIRLAAGAAESQDTSLFRLPLHVRVPVEQLSYPENGGGALANVTIKVMTVNAETRTLSITDRSLSLPRPGKGAGEMIDIRIDLDLEAGTQMFAIGVRDNASGEASFVSTTIEIDKQNSPS